MDGDETAALELLSTRPLWAIDELPPLLDVDILRCLDGLTFVEARAVIMWNNQKYEGDPAPRVPNPMPWCSPIRQPGACGDWEAVIRMRTRNDDVAPAEVRISEAGKVELSRRRRLLAVSRQPVSGAISAIARGIRKLPSMMGANGDSCERGGMFVAAALKIGAFDDPLLIEIKIGLEQRLALPNEPGQPNPFISAWVVAAEFAYLAKGITKAIFPDVGFAAHCEAIAGMLDDIEEKGRSAQKAGAAPRRKKRKSPLVRIERPLTLIEVRTLEVVGRHGRNFAQAAQELKVDPKTVRENYERALKKMNRATTSRSVATTGLPNDRRGQPCI